MTATTPPVASSQDNPQTEFEALYPALKKLARHAFRGLRCPHDRDDAVSSALVHAWDLFRAQASEGQEIDFYTLLCLAVVLARRERRRDDDFLSRYAQKRPGYRVTRLC
jgi:hypothetical protein